MIKFPDKIWHIQNGNRDLEKELESTLHISSTLARLLINRNLTEIKTVSNFLFPSLEHLHSPFLFKEIGKAIERVEIAITEKEKILIYGDSDVDGVTSTALLLRYLQKRTSFVTAHISGEEGYSLKPEVIQEAQREGISLIISVDCGITNFDEARLMSDLGMDLIILDHHEAQEPLPHAVAVMDAKVPNSTYPFRDLAGVGTALKFITGCFIARFDDFPRSLYAVDVETTGLDALTAEIIELGVVRFHYGIPVDHFSCMVKPTHPIPAEVTEITGIQDSDVSQGLTLKEAMLKFLDFIGEAPLVGHNISFDYSFLKKAIKTTLGRRLKNKLFDTLPLARAHYPHMPNHRLETLTEKLQIPHDVSHRAIPDAQSTGELYFHLVMKRLQQKITKFTNNFLDLVCLGTIADVVPLRDENRVLTKSGLEILKRSPSIGIRMLIERRQGDKDIISSRDIAWGIAPIINAAGRVGKGSLSLDLLLANKKRIARSIIRELEELNRSQKMRVQMMIQHYMALVPEQIQFPRDRLIFLYSDDQETGITGIVANKFLDKYGLPSFIVTSNKDVAIGSGRAYGNIDLVAILDECKEFLLQYGGHQHAAGFTLEKTSVEPFRSHLSNILGQLIKGDDLIPQINIDLHISPENLHLSLLDDLESLEPFGQENHHPLLCLTHIIPLDISTFGMNDLHLRLIIDGQEPLTAIGWNKGYLCAELKSRTKPLDIAFTLQKNTWRGRTSLCLIIEHVKFSAATKNFSGGTIC